MDLGTLAELAAKEKRTEWKYFTPSATLVSGGSPPDFVTSATVVVLFEHGSREVEKRSFHILDAIDYYAGRATTPGDLFLTYARLVRPSGVLSVHLPPYHPLTVVPPIYVPSDVDPSGVRRLEAFHRAAAALDFGPRVVAIVEEDPALTTEEFIDKWLNAELDIEDEAREQDETPCELQYPHHIRCEELGEYDSDGFDGALKELLRFAGYRRDQIRVGAPKRVTDGPCATGPAETVGEHWNIYERHSRRTHVGSIASCPCCRHLPTAKGVTPIIDERYRWWR